MGSPLPLRIKDCTRGPVGFFDSPKVARLMIAHRIIGSSIPAVQVRCTMGEEHVDGKVELLPEPAAFRIDGSLDAVHQSLVMRAVTCPAYLEWPDQTKER